MSNPAESLKQRLLQHLDSDNNVINEQGVLAAVTLWEKFPVTREVLEATRIGRHVNELRKKTTNKDLARRAKELVRKWQSAPSVVTNGRLPQPDVTADQPRLQVSRSGQEPASGRNIVRDGYVAERLSADAAADRPRQSAGGKTPSLVTSKSAPRLAAVTPTTSPVPPPIVPTRSELKLKIRTNASGIAAVFTDDLSLASDSSKPSSPALLSSVAAASGTRSPLTVGDSKTTRISSPVVFASKSQGVSSLEQKSDSNGKSRLPPGLVANGVKRFVVGDRDSPSLRATAAATSDLYTNSTNDFSARKKRTSNGNFKSEYEQGIRPANTSYDVTGDKVLSSESHQLESRSDDGYRLNYATDILDASRSAATAGTSRDLPGTSRGGEAAPNKVQTTAELMNRLHKDGMLRLRRSETIERIVSGQISREADDLNAPVVPVGVKPRTQKNRRSLVPPATPAGGLGPVKTEMVHKFLQMSVPSTSPVPPVGIHEPSGKPSSANNVKRLLDELEPEPLAAEVPAFDVVVNRPKRRKVVAVAADVRVSSATPASEPLGFVHPTRETTITDAYPHSLLPAFDPSTIDWSTTSYEAPSPREDRPVTDAEVDELHTKHLPGINGQYDYRNEWTEWTSMLTLPSTDSNLLHILPYVNIDD